MISLVTLLILILTLLAAATPTASSSTKTTSKKHTTTDKTSATKHAGSDTTTTQTAGSSTKPTSKKHTTTDTTSATKHAGSHTTTTHTAAAAGGTVVSIPLANNNGYWVGTFGVGNNDSLSLAIATNFDGIYVNHDVYRSSGTGLSINVEEGEWELQSKRGTVSFNYTITSGNAYVPNMEVSKQTLGVLTSHDLLNNYNFTKLPHDGVLGLLYPTVNKSRDQATAPFNTSRFIQNLCLKKQLRQCRFGIATRSNGQGSLVLGGVNNTLITSDGFIGSTHVNNKTSWTITGKVFVNETVPRGFWARDQILTFDTTQPWTMGPIPQVLEIFNDYNITPVGKHVASGAIITGEYDCTQPPVLVVQVGKAVLRIDENNLNRPTHGNGTGAQTCTLGLAGYSGFLTEWILGQDWFRGKYVDFSLEAGNVSVGYLKEGALWG